MTRPLCAVLTLAALLASASGCVAVAAAGAGAGTYAYITGNLEKTIDAPIDRVYQATIAAVEDMGYTLSDSRADALEARVEAQQADGTDVKINLDARGESATRTSIRVGLIGDKEQSIRILERIESRL